MTVENTQSSKPLWYRWIKGVSWKRLGVLRGLLAFAVLLALVGVAPLPAAAQTSDVALTVSPTGQLVGGDTVFVGGEVSCSTTTVTGSGACQPF